ncbi:MAG: hypothetical protein AB7O73_00575 [Bacteroidia bacterium]
MNIKRFILIYQLSFLLVLLSFFACKKKEQLSSINAIPSPVSQIIRKSYWPGNNSGFICGGNKNEFGFIYKTIDNGITWQNVFSNTKCIYDILKINDTLYYACGDSLLLLRSADGGNSWNKIKFNFELEHFNWTPLRHLFGNYRLLMAIGGENYSNGNALWLEDDQLRWVWHFDTEFRTGIPFSNENYHLLGYGNSQVTKTYGYNYVPGNFKGDFITSSFKINNSTAFICGNDGGIYKTEDAGKSWKTIIEKNKVAKKRMHFISIAFLPNSKGMCIDNSGIVYTTNDGDVWNTKEFSNNETPMHVAPFDANTFCVSFKNGSLKLFQF